MTSVTSASRAKIIPYQQELRKADVSLTSQTNQHLLFLFVSSSASGSNWEKQVKTSSHDKTLSDDEPKEWKVRWVSPSLLLLCSTHSIRCSMSLLNFFWDLGPKNWEQMKQTVYWCYTRGNKTNQLHEIPSCLLCCILPPSTTTRLTSLCNTTVPVRYSWLAFASTLNFLAGFCRLRILSEESDVV